MDKMGQNFHKIEAVRLEGGDPPPPPPRGRRSPRFLPVLFFDYFPKLMMSKLEDRQHHYNVQIFIGLSIHLAL